MQGIVKDGNGGYVKAAIVSFRRLTANTDPEDVSKEETIYAQTDDEGNFIIENLDPEGKYMIDVLIEGPKSVEVEPKTESETKTELKANQELRQEEKQEKKPENEEETENGEPKNDEESEYDDENEYEEEFKIEFTDADEPPYVEDRSNDYDESFYDIPKDPEVSETFAGNVIKPNKELEGKLYILKSNMW